MLNAFQNLNPEAIPEKEAFSWRKWGYAIYLIVITIFIIVQSTFFLKSHDFINTSIKLQNISVFILVIVLLTSIFKWFRHKKWNKVMWSANGAALVVTFPFTIAPVLDFGVVCVIIYGLILFTAPLSLVYLSSKKNPNNIDWNAPLLTGLFIALGWLTLETIARIIPNSPYTYQERNYNANYRPTFAIIDSSHTNPLFNQKKKVNLTVELNTTEFFQRLSYNQWGFNDQPWPDPKDTTVDVWLALGDSFTEGIGTDVSGTWPSVLQSALQNPLRAKPIRVLNAGFSGADPLQSFLILDTLTKSYNIKQVIWALNGSDMEEVKVRGLSHERLLTEYYHLFEYGFGFSFVFRIFMLNVFKYDYRGYSQQENEIKNKVAIQYIQNTLLKADSLANTRKFSIYKFIIPFSYEYNNQLSNGCVTELECLLESSKVRGLLGCYCSKHKSTPVDSLYWPIDLHHTPKGYRLMAECIYESLPDSLKQPTGPSTQK